MPPIAIVTCRNIPEPDPDEALLMRALADAGLDATLRAWDDPAFRPADYALCVLRSCWNYFETPSRFVEWAGEVEPASRLANPPSVVRWNHHKGYLDDITGTGVPVVPTAWVDRGERAELETLMDDNGWDRVVVKPAVSAGSYRTRSFTRDQLGDGQRFLDDLSADRDTMVQRFMDEVAVSGEMCVIAIDGQYTHTIRKEPRFAGGVEKVSDALPVTDDQRAFADRALACVDGPLLYARTDIIPDGNGGFVLSELELIEPSLFLRQSAAATRRLVDAIGRWQHGDTSGGGAA